MRTFRLALAQINATVGDLEGNAEKIVEYIDRARGLNADMVAFPELALTGYPPEDLLFKPQFIQDNLARLEQVAKESQGIAVVLGFIDADADVYNAAALIYDRRVLGTYRKMYLPNYGVFDEDRYFKSGDVCPVYTVNGTPVGVNICEDIWYAIGPTVVQRDAGAEVIVNINGSPFHTGKRSSRERMLATRASDNGLFVAYVNLVGGQDELVFDGGSMVLSPEGDIVAQASQFKEELLVADLEVESVFRSRLREPRSRREKSGMSEEIGRPLKVNVSEFSPDGARPKLEKATPCVLDEVGEVYEALVTGTRDYIEKCGFEKVLIAISGGVDSALVAAIAVDALGGDNVVGVSMPSRFSSEGSVLDARELADNLGIELWSVPIEPPFEAFLDSLSPYFKGTDWGVAEENIQSRIRGNLIMAMSNKFGWIVLTTGNKSEMATGYATIYGDMSGGFAVIKDVPKTLVYELCRHRNDKGEKPFIPLSIIEKPPSAELRPDQLDEDSLPPYATLDPILKAYVEDDRTYDEILGMGFEEADVQRAISLVDRNEYKRRQAPPGIKITPRSFGRDRRMPIANRYRPF
ncbi:MAG: NAD+ synthase [Chloroflexi bacterium]|nr:NAD+ synthase [Chloroflexota bacterium]